MTEYRPTHNGRGAIARIRAVQDPSQTIAAASGGASTPLILQPTRSFTITGNNQSFPNLTASPDGRAVYVLSTRPAVNLWKSLVAHSPEILTLIGCLMTLLVLRR